MKAVDQNGTYLKYFGSKQDTVYIKDRLMSVRIRWKKLLQTADEARRILEHACRENKRVKCSVALFSIKNIILMQSSTAVVFW